MTVECENCNTRFHVADARIPAKGARVRCSRCHHRFHITPSSAPPKQPSAGAQGSAEEPVLGGEASREEDQLDHPEFIFDRPDTGRTRPGRAAALESEFAQTRPVQPHLAEPPEPATPAPPREEHIVSSGGVTAQQLLDDGAPDLPTGRLEIAGALGETDSMIGSPDDGAASSARPAPADDLIDFDAPVERLAPPRPGSADIAALAAELGEDEDTSLSDWDPLATPASASTAIPADEPLAPVAPSPKPATSSPAPRPKRRALAETPAFDPEAAGPIGLVLRVAAAIVGLALLAGAGRLLWLQRDVADFAPEVVQAAGWIAADLETFLARSGDGERVVVVRGNLFPEGSAPPPDVEVRLIGGDGEALVASPRTWLERIDDAEISPERLAIRLAGSGGEIGAMGELVTGFTAVIADPPPGVRRIEVRLSARERAPTGTATADAPPAPAAPPALEPATETAAPGPVELPSAEAPADVLPAAPAPE
ncbi:MAG: hypothetical protein FJ108_08775 [Deltaproteobacteria bacterium]|nr:hypothetical protein [Deltaproteobacteria bacterium]